MSKENNLGNSYDALWQEEGCAYGHIPRTPEAYLEQHQKSLDFRLKTYGQEPLVKGLTVLIPTMPERKEFLDILLRELERQGLKVLIDSREAPSSGKKRNALLADVETTFVSFVDDDDWISWDYGKMLSLAIQSAPQSDYIVFDAAYFIDQESGKLAKFGIEYSGWQWAPDSYYRDGSHIMCWRTSIARSYPFPDFTFCEDRNWTPGVVPLVKNQARIEKILYAYEFLTGHTLGQSEAKQKEFQEIADRYGAPG
ncbi:MAG: glycosyltransferase family 2 protein [Cyanobacteria bacterium]|nr:glycosyltransferase family 2 protein [Cyanobacteriota bacterium]